LSFGKNWLSQNQHYKHKKSICFGSLIIPIACYSVVADRRMLSKNNWDITTNNGFEYIIGERLKNEIQKPLLDIKFYCDKWTYNDNKGKTVAIKYTFQLLEGKTII
jgi:hypothetical protein